MNGELDDDVSRARLDRISAERATMKPGEYPEEQPMPDAASPSPSEMDVVGYFNWSELHQKDYFDKTARGISPKALVTLLSAQSALAALSVQVLRLTEENEALFAWFDGLTPNEMHEAIKRDKTRIKALEEALRPFVVYAPEACFLGNGKWTPVQTMEAGGGWIGAEDFRRARSALKENAL